MKTLALVGKIDTRIIAYPLARALSLLGMTAIISEDGSYRRLCYGDETTGTVSGVDISVGPLMNEDLFNSLNKSGVDYDYRILVTSSYIPESVDGAIVCTGIDRTMGNVEDEEKSEKEETQTKKTPPKKKGEGSNLPTLDLDDKLDLDGTTECNTEEEKIERVLVESNPRKLRDKVELPSDLPNKTVIISFDVREKKGVTCIPMKDANIKYLFECDERQELLPIQDKSMVTTIVNLTAEMLGLSATELLTAFNRKEYLASSKVK